SGPLVLWQNQDASSLAEPNTDFFNNIGPEAVIHGSSETEQQRSKALQRCCAPVRVPRLGQPARHAAQFSSRRARQG
ncbi:MAG TPA: hypothetical protein VE687_19130, partial [Stellaceae bacterium]|nr:hypothetical protein [Stellaceae bacterium]